MRLTSTLLLIASIFCTAECTSTVSSESSKELQHYERIMAEGLVRYMSMHTRSDSVNRKKEILDERADGNYTLNTKHKEESKCIVSITDSPTGGLTAVPELCHFFGIPEGASSDYAKYYREQVDRIATDVTRLFTPESIRLNNPGSAISSVFRVMLAHSVLNYEDYQPTMITPEFVAKYAKYKNLIKALGPSEGPRHNIKFSQHIPKIAARILENGFAYGARTHMPDGKAYIISGMTEFQVGRVRQFAMEADAETIYDELGALDALLGVFYNNDIRLIMSSEPNAMARAYDDILSLLNNDPRGIVLLQKIQSGNDEINDNVLLLVDLILTKAQTLFSDSKDDLGDRMWRYAEHLATHTSLLNITVNVVLNHYLPISMLERKSEILNYIKNIDREFPLITTDIADALITGAEAERELKDLRRIRSRRVTNIIRTKLGTLLNRNQDN